MSGCIRSDVDARREFEESLPCHHATLRKLASEVLRKLGEGDDSVGPAGGGHRYRHFERCVNAVSKILGDGRSFPEITSA